MDPSERGASAWHSYRCPVCGHTDEVDPAEVPGGTLPCSHCSTPLELLVRSPDQAAVAVKVASRWRRTK
ncbi:MAG TPA: hypothetical protein VLH75_10960 [Longimicrobiales bacterium]|nr:hypothetical protein [Longimicrobiales bacterium]